MRELRLTPVIIANYNDLENSWPLHFNILLKFSSFVPISVDTQSEAVQATGRFTPRSTQDSGSVASTVTFESISKIEKRLDNSEQWMERNDQTLNKLLRMMEGKITSGEADDNRDPTQTDAVAGSARGGGS